MTIDKTALQEAQQLTHMRDTGRNELRTAEENQVIKAKLNAEVAGYTDERDLVNRLIGRIQFAQGLSKLTKAISLVDLALIKEKGLHRVLLLAGTLPDGISAPKGPTVGPFPDGTPAIEPFPDGISAPKGPTVGTWEGFCKALGMSKQKVNEDLQNLSVFGDEALAAMNRCGLGYRDLRKLRQLPEGERSIVVGEIEADLGDRESIVSLIDEMAAKHAQEKESLQKRNAGLQADLDSSRERVAEKTSEIEDLKEQIDRRGRSPIDEREQELGKLIEGKILGVLGAIYGLDAAISQVMEWKDAPQQLVNSCHYAVERTRTGLLDLRTKYALPEHYEDPDLPWMQEVQREKAARHKPQGGGLEAPLLDEAGASEVP